MSEQQYTREEADEILRLAAELEAQAPAADSQMTLSDLEAVARESGIDPALVRQAATSLQAGSNRPAGGFRILGEATKLERVFTVGGSADFNNLADAMGSHFGEMGHQHSTADTMQWRTTGQSGRHVEIRVRRRGEATTVHVTEHLGALVGGLFGGIGGGVGGGLGGGLAWLFAMMFGAVGAALWVVGVLAFAFMLARTLFVRVARKRQASLDELVTQIQHEARELSTDDVVLDLAEERHNVSAESAR